MLNVTQELQLSIIANLKDPRWDLEIAYKCKGFPRNEDGLAKHRKSRENTQESGLTTGGFSEFYIKMPMPPSQQHLETNAKSTCFLQHMPTRPGKSIYFWTQSLFFTPGLCSSLHWDEGIRDLKKVLRLYGKKSFQGRILTCLQHGVEVCLVLWDENL